MKKWDRDIFIAEARKRHGETYCYDNTNYLNSSSEVEIICTKHGSFSQRPCLHVRGQGCPICAQDVRKQKLRSRNQRTSLSLADFLNRAREVHGDTYTYEDCGFSGIRSHVTIGCPLHGSFLQMAQAHIHNKQGCPICFREHRRWNPEFVDIARRLHGDKYDYSIIKAARIDGKVQVVCCSHGPFWVRPADHINEKKRQGCPKCWEEVRQSRLTTSNRRRALSNDEFIHRAMAVHSDQYDYEHCEYIGLKHSVAITCPVHGVFWQKAYIHLDGSGCSRCANVATSKLERQWLTSLGIPEACWHRKLSLPPSFVIVDGIDITGTIVYEFLGDFWHGNPDTYDQSAINPRTRTTFGELWAATQMRLKKIEAAGYQTITMWESKWISSIARVT